MFQKASLCDFLMIVKVSSTNLFHSVGGHGNVARAIISRSSMNKFATMGLIGDPMAAPSFCSYNLPWNTRYVFLRQNSSRQEMCFTVMVVLRCKLLSSSRSFFMMSNAGSMGMEVKRAFTSKAIIHSSGFNLMSSKLCMKSWLFFTWCGHFPTRGLSILDSSLAVT